MRTAYTHELRSIECPKCGAPVVAPTTAADVVCNYCGTQQRLAARRSLVPDAPQVDEAARLAGLRLQFAQQNPAQPALFRIPEGLEPYLAMLGDARARPAAIAAIRQDWERTRARMSESPDHETGLRLFRLAYFLSMFYTLDNDHEHSRAVLDTALELTQDPAHADILRSSLARLALEQGDEEAFRAWLAGINPRPILLEADSSYRVTVARYHLARNEHAKVIEILGPNYGEIPFSSEITALAGCLRAHAQAALGQDTTCRAEIEGLVVRHGAADVLLLFAKNRGPASPIAEQVVRGAGRVVGIGGSAAGGKAAKGIGCFSVAITLVTTVIPGVLGLSAALYPYPWFELAGSPNAYDVAIQKVRDCPTTRAALGDDIQGTFGFGCGGCEMGGGSGNIDWNVPIEGTRGSGQLYFHGVQSAGRWSVTSAHVETGGQQIDLVACVPNAAPSLGGIETIGTTTTTTTTTTIPGDVGGLGGANQGEIVRVVLESQCTGGNGGACWSLGTMYQQGAAGLPRDQTRARQWFTRACQLGHQAACNER
ncbi:MAG: SEL1-like repeat protein [Deltaproteobacteria bacterium]|nr:SEL1-like repeat protein [Deltaproteobacteria bacterium]